PFEYATPHMRYPLLWHANRSSSPRFFTTPNEIHARLQTSIPPFCTYPRADGHEPVATRGVMPVMEDDSTARAPLMDRNDAELIDAMMEGDHRALEILYDRYSRPVFSFALRILEDREHAEELLQE